MKFLDKLLRRAPKTAYIPQTPTGLEKEMNRLKAKADAYFEEQSKIALAEMDRAEDLVDHIKGKLHRITIIRVRNTVQVYPIGSTTEIQIEHPIFKAVQFFRIYDRDYEAGEREMTKLADFVVKAMAFEKSEQKQDFPKEHFKKLDDAVDALEAALRKS